jgi:hypothetical protein
MAATRNAADDLVGVTDIGRMFGVSKQRAGQLMDERINPDAPEAIETTRGRLWKRSAVIKYAREILHRDVLEVPR